MARDFPSKATRRAVRQAIVAALTTPCHPDPARPNAGEDVYNNELFWYIRNRLALAVGREAY